MIMMTIIIIIIIIIMAYVFVFGRTSCLFGFCGKHTLPPERYLVTLCLSSELISV